MGLRQILEHPCAKVKKEKEKKLALEEETMIEIKDRLEIAIENLCNLERLGENHPRRSIRSGRRNYWKGSKWAPDEAQKERCWRENEHKLIDYQDEFTDYSANWEEVPMKAQ